MADKILIVDDDAAVLSLLNKVIRSNGLDATCAESAETALDLLSAKLGKEPDIQGAQQTDDAGQQDHQHQQNHHTAPPPLPRSGASGSIIPGIVVVVSVVHDKTSMDKV